MNLNFLRRVKRFTVAIPLTGSTHIMCRICGNVLQQDILLPKEPCSECDNGAPEYYYRWHAITAFQAALLRSGKLTKENIIHKARGVL